ncbi:MAG: Xaa-Pro peptidase family protein [Chloroflexi bacterium]|nr:Xaa-Pro peptidase family protein [Chloroflexota bacterium]
MADITELRQRWNKLAQVGGENDLDLILVYFDEYNMADACYLTNIWTQFERGLVAISLPSGDPCLLVGPETANYVMTHTPELESRVVSLFLAWGAAYPNTHWEDTADVLADLAGGPPRRIGLVGGGFLPLSLYQALSSMTGEIVDITDSVHRARQIKSASEIDKIRTAYRIVDAGLEAMLNGVTPGMTETALAGIGEAAMRAAGAEGYAYSTILTSQERTNSVFGRPTQRPLDDGSFIMIGISPRYQGYAASLGVPLTVGPVPQKQRDYIRDLFTIYQSIEAQLRPGLMASELYHSSRRELARYDLEKHQIYGVVHSCGLLEAEAPFLCPDPDWQFQPGMVLLIDLAIFHPQLWGIRWESGYLITDDGAEQLSAYFDTAADIVLRRAASGA